MESSGGKSHLFTLLSLFALSGVVHADVVLDGSTGSSGALTGPSFQITESLGQRAGANLLHSFSQFSIDQNETAVFSGDASIQNIISRVTGGDITTIDGTLRSTIAGANLFFLNPAGIIVGENAVLDIGGALHLSTASELQFADGSSLPTTSNAPVTLTSASPSAFGFLNTQQGSIQFQGADLDQTAGQFVGLSAANVSFDNADIAVPQGQIEIATTTQTANVSIQPDSYNIQAESRSGNVSVTNGSDVIAGAGTIRIQGGELIINQSQLNVNNEIETDGGRIEIFTSGDVLLTGDDVGGFSSGGRIRAHTSSSGSSEGILIDADGSIIIENSFLVGSIVLEIDTQGSAGDVILLSNDEIHITDSVIAARTRGSGASGNILIQSQSDQVFTEASFRTISDTSSFSGLTEDSAGEAGDITFISGADITFVDSFVDTRTIGLGNIASAGDLILRGDDISILDETRFDARAFANSGNDAQMFPDFTLLEGNGDLDIRANNILIESSSISLTSGNTVFGGQLTLIANESVILRSAEEERSDRSFIGASSDANTLIQTPVFRMSNSSIRFGDTGFFTSAPYVFELNAETVVLENGANIRVNYTGEDGVVNFNVSDSITLSSNSEVNRNDNSIEIDTGSFDAIGDGPSLFITTPVLTIQGDESFLETAGFFRSEAGDININVDRLDILDGAGIRSSEALGATDGFININATDSVNILSDGTVDADDEFPTSYIGVERTTSFIVSSSDPDSSGSIFINTPHITLDGGEILASNTTTGTESGTISLISDTLSILNGSQIQSNNSASDTVGQINLSVSDMITLSGTDRNGDISRITSFGLRGGNGGMITIQTDNLSIDGASIGASTIPRNDEDTNNSSRAGDLLFTIQNIELLNGGQVLSTVSNADAGNINVTASNTILIDGFRPSLTSSTTVFPSGFASASREGGVGNGGSIMLSAPNLIMNDGVITTESRGAGDAGNVMLTIDNIQITNDALISSEGRGTGNAGSITINSSDLSLDNATIAVTSQNQGDAGDINISSSNTLRLENNARIRARALGDGSVDDVTLNGGNINLIVGDLISLNNSEISTLVDAGTGNGGDVFIDPIFVVLNNSIIIADAQGGNGGNIDLISDFFFNLNSVLSASSELGVDGQIDIAAPEVNLTSQLAIQSADFLGNDRVLTSSCNSFQQESRSSLVLIPQNGFPIEPLELLH